MEKPDSTIIDATAGNRSIWELKEHPRILYLDVEPDLAVPPDILCDTRNTQLPENSKFFAVFDPPHDWGRKKNASIFSTPSLKVANEKWPKYYRDTPPRYYGPDKYQTKTDLLNYIHETQKEIARILIPGGILFLKWGEVRLPVMEVLKYFSLWDIMLKIPVKDNGGEHSNPTYWVMMIRKDGPWPQTELNKFFRKDGGKKDAD